MPTITVYPAVSADDGYFYATSGGLNSVSIATQGSGYSESNILTLTTGTGSGTGGAVEIVEISGGVIIDWSVSTPGTGYVTGEVYNTTGGSGENCTIQVGAVLASYFKNDFTTLYMGQESPPT